MMLRKLLSLIALLASAQCHATLIGYAGGAVVPGLYEFDPSTGSSTFLTPVQPSLAAGGMAVLGNSTYVTNWFPSVGSPSVAMFAQIDTVNGLVTPIANQTSNNWFGLTADPVHNVMYVMDLEDPVLRTITPTGVIATIGVGLGLTVPNGIRGMAYDSRRGVLYASGYYDQDPHLYTIDTTTGLATDLGSAGLQLADFGGDIPMVYVDALDTVFAADSVARKLYRLDTNNDRLVAIGATGLPVASLAWTSTVPEPSTAALSLGALAALFMRISKRKNQP